MLRLSILRLEGWMRWQEPCRLTRARWTHFHITQSWVEVQIDEGEVSSTHLHISLVLAISWSAWSSQIWGWMTSTHLFISGFPPIKMGNPEMEVHYKATHSQLRVGWTSLTSPSSWLSTSPRWWCLVLLCLEWKRQKQALGMLPASGLFKVYLHIAASWVGFQDSCCGSNRFWDYSGLRRGDWTSLSIDLQTLTWLTRQGLTHVLIVLSLELLSGGELTGKNVL